MEEIIVGVLYVIVSPIIVAIVAYISTRNTLPSKVESLEKKVDEFIDLFNNYRKENVRNMLEKKVLRMIEMEEYPPSCLREFHLLSQQSKDLGITLDKEMYDNIKVVNSRIRGKR